MRPNPQFPADLVTFTGEILNKNLHFAYNDVFARCLENLFQLLASVTTRIVLS